MTKIKLWHVYDMNGTNDPSNDPNNEGYGADLEFSFVMASSPIVPERILEIFSRKKAREELITLFKTHQKELCGAKSAHDASNEEGTIYISQEFIERYE